MIRKHRRRRRPPCPRDAQDATTRRRTRIQTRLHKSLTAAVGGHRPPVSSRETTDERRR